MTTTLSNTEAKANRRYQLIGFAFAIIGSALFSFRPILVKFAYQEQLDSVTLLALRMLFSAPFYIVLLCIFMRDPKRREPLNTSIVLQAGLIGFMGYYVSSLVDLIGLQYISAQLERMLLFTYPTLVVIFGALFFRRKITGNTLLALAFSYCGIAFIFTHDLKYYGDDIVKGSFFVCLSSLIFAFYVLFGKQIINKIGSRLFTCIAMISASIGIMVHFFITNDISDLHTSTRIYFICFAIAIFCTILPSFFISEAIARIGPDRNSIVGTIGPVFTTLFAVSLLDEAFTHYHVLGMLLVIIGVSVLGYKKSTRQPRV